MVLYTIMVVESPDTWVDVSEELSASILEPSCTNSVAQPSETRITSKIDKFKRCR